MELRIFTQITAVLSIAMAAGVCVGDEIEDTPYRLGAGDTVKVTVYGHADLSAESEIDGEGRISLPLVQHVNAAGLTPAELEAAVADKLKPDYLKNPRVSVEVVNYRPFYILGEVKTPGSYPYVSGMSVINAVAVAGGFTYRARTKKFLINRTDGRNRQKIEAAPGTLVLPGDVIEIPERFF
jgi:protein involved in polysaccharide export with SLBB domain